jgi:hypothetical protein
MKRILIAALLTSFFYQTTIAQLSACDNQFCTGSGRTTVRLTPYSFAMTNNKWNRGFSDSTPVKMSDSLSSQYFQKGKRLETTGIVLLGVGLGIGIPGLIGTLNYYDVLNGNGSGYGLLFVAGLAATITSIPVFITGAHYKRKAKLVMHSENISYSYHVPVNANMYSAGVAISLR